MKTTITTIEEAAAIIGRDVYLPGEDGCAPQLSHPLTVGYCVTTPLGTFLSIGGVVLDTPLPITLHLVTAQPEEHTGALATWEATVRPALVRAMAKHGELWGAAIMLESPDHGSAETYEVKISGKGWDATAEIRRDSVVDIEADCAALAKLAAGEVAKARETGGVDLRARVLAYGGDVPLVAREEPSGHPAADVLRYAEQRQAERAIEALPREWTWDSQAPCVAYRVEPCCFAQITLSGDRHQQGRVPPEVWAAVEARARRLGIAPEQPEVAKPAPSTERTPLPAGWSWDDPRPPFGCLCCANGPANAYALVEIKDENAGCIVGPARKIPTIRAALITEAKRLGLPCHEEMPTQPDGYEFTFDEDGDVWVRWGPRASEAAIYYKYRGAPDFLNTDPSWSAHEDARQWAAYLLGEVAPPLREEGAAL